MFGFDETPLPHVSAVVLARGAQQSLRPCVEALLGSDGVNVEIVLVDNGAAPDVRWLAELPGVTVVEDGADPGAGSGWAVGVAASTGPYVALVDGGVVVGRAALARLVEELARPGVGVTAGTATSVHLLGLTWPGDDLGPPGGADPTDAVPTPIAAAGDTVLVTTRAHWDRLDGLGTDLTDFSIRTWQLGLAVVGVPDATARYVDEASRDRTAAEQDRLQLLLTSWGARALVLLAVPLLGLELGRAARAIGRGRLGGQLRAWAWLGRNRRAVWRRRQAVQRARSVPDRVWMRVLTDRLDRATSPVPGAVRAPLDALTRGWWRLVSRLV
jgi:hypothetical protein